MAERLCSREHFSVWMHISRGCKLLKEAVKGETRKSYDEGPNFKWKHTQKSLITSVIL